MIISDPVVVTVYWWKRTVRGANLGYLLTVSNFKGTYRAGFPDKWVNYSGFELSVPYKFATEGLNALTTLPSYL